VATGLQITVLGLGHLGCVTAASTAKHFTVTGLDFDAANLTRLLSGHAPIAEPGLDALIAAGLASQQLRFTGDLTAACAAADILWVTYDTPVDDDDQSDIESVLREIRRCVPALPKGSLVLISSQLPVGTCRLLEQEFAATATRFACSPENLRLGQALDVFNSADRIIAGCRDEQTKTQLATLFKPFTREVVWMRPESAEMTKHAINSFLATSITFMNEVARICEVTGADAKEVERGLKSESRIGPRAYLSPGNAFAGGTLARDVVTLGRLGGQLGEPLELLPAIKRSNDHHRTWAAQKLTKLFAGQTGRRVALVGLTYKPGTNTLRRSSAVELARVLSAAGFEVRACDPSKPELPADLGFIRFHADAATAMDGADAIVVCTEWPEFRAIDWTALLPRLRRPLVIDAGRFLENALADQRGVQYVAVGSNPEARRVATKQPFSPKTPEPVGKKLVGVNAIVTGASQGLGLEIARQFVQEGASVALCARDPKRLEHAAGELRKLGTASQKVLSFVCDVSDPKAVHAFAAAAIAGLGSVQVLVNNAGIYGPKGPTEAVEFAEWKQAMEVNLYGVLLPCRALIPHFKAAGRGKIINLSGGGATSPMPNISAYAASKAAVVRLTETLAEELRADQVDVNAVAPGALNTRFLDEVLAAGPHSVGEGFYQRALKQKESGGAPLGLGASLCVWLASPASDGITGKLLSAQWDPWQDFAARRDVLAKSDIYTLRRIVPEDRGQKFS